MVFEKVSRLKAKDRLTQRAQMKWEVKGVQVVVDKKMDQSKKEFSP